MSIITQDALKTITEQLSPTSRLNLAAIDQRFFEVATKWRDVKTIVFDDEDVTMAGSNFVHSFEITAFQMTNAGLENHRSHYKTDAKEVAIKLCPALKKMIVQTKLSDYDAVMLNKLNLKILKLYIGTENLSLTSFPRFEKLRTLHIVVNSTKELKVVDVVEPRVLMAAFPQTLTRICLTGIYLTEILLTHMSNLANLVCLDTIGCLVDTRVGAKYVPILEKFPVLDELSLPPSLFSFASKSNTPADLTLKGLKVTKLGLFMDQFDDDNFYSQTCRCLPKQLKVLVVFGNYVPLKKWKQLSKFTSFMIIFGPNTALASCPQTNLTNAKLLSHLVRGPPYLPQEYNPNFLRNHDVIIGNLSWQFSLIEWKDNSGSKKEVMALRKRMNVLDDEDVVFEGVRIPPPVVLERFGQLRERRLFPVSPNGFLVFGQPIPLALPPPPPPLPARAPLPTTPPPSRHRSRGRRRDQTLSRLATSAALRRVRSAPAALGEAPVPVRRSDSMRTNPPSPIGTRSGAVLVGTLPAMSPINNSATASQIGGTASLNTVSTVPTVALTNTATSVLNRGFSDTPSAGTTQNLETVTGTSESRRLSTASQISTFANSEMTMNSTETASPERLPTSGVNNRNAPLPLQNRPQAPNNAQNSENAQQ